MKWLQIMATLSNSNTNINITQAALAYNELVIRITKLMNVTSVDFFSLTRLLSQLSDNRLQSMPVIWQALQGLVQNGMDLNG